MKELEIREIIASRVPGFLGKYPLFVERLVIHCLGRLLREEEINSCIRKHGEASGLAFIDEVFEEFNFSYFLSSIDRNKIPSEGKLIVVANHPLGALDGLALLRAISDVRADTKIITNDVLMVFENLASLFLPYNVFSAQTQKEHVARIGESLLAEEAVLFFSCRGGLPVDLEGHSRPQMAQWSRLLCQKVRRAGSAGLRQGQKFAPLLSGLAAQQEIFHASASPRDL